MFGVTCGVCWDALLPVVCRQTCDRITQDSGSISTILSMRLLFSWQCKYTHVHSSIGVVNQHIQPAILFTFDPLEQLFNFFVVCRITDNWQTVSAPLLYLCWEQTCQLWTAERNPEETFDTPEKKSIHFPVAMLSKLCTRNGQGGRTAECGSWGCLLQNDGAIIRERLVNNNQLCRSSKQWPWCSSCQKFHLCSGLFQSLLLAPCDVDCGSGLGQLEGDSPAYTSGGTCDHTHPARQGHFPWGRTQHHIQSAVSQKPPCKFKGEKLSGGLCW